MDVSDFLVHMKEEFEELSDNKIRDLLTLVKVGCLVYDNTELLPTTCAREVRSMTKSHFKGILKNETAMYMLRCNEKYFDDVLSGMKIS